MHKVRRFLLLAMIPLVAGQIAVWPDAARAATAEARANAPGTESPVPSQDLGSRARKYQGSRGGAR